MRILTAPIADVNIDDVEAFVALQIKESQFVEYKANWPENPSPIGCAPLLMPTADCFCWASMRIATKSQR